MQDYFENDNDVVNEGTNLREVLDKYLKQWKLFILSVIIAMGLSYVYLQLQIPIYSLQTTVLIKDNSGSTAGDKGLLKDLNVNSSDKIIDNEIEILKSNTMVERVVSSLNLEISYYIQNQSSIS